jgi:hypothetical protein
MDALVLHEVGVVALPSMISQPILRVGSAAWKWMSCAVKGKERD